MLFIHIIDTTVFNDYVIFTKKTGGILQLINKQLEVMTGRLILKYSKPRNFQKVEGFLTSLVCQKQKQRNKNPTAV
jgi:hypothetical protein